MSLNETNGSYKVRAGDLMPEFTLPTVDGGEAKIGGVSDRCRLIVVYRGLHCPMCIDYFKSLEARKTEFDEIEIDIVAMSGDPKDRATEFASRAGVTFPVAYDMSLDQMRSLGLYISAPKMRPETDRPFAEPGTFLVNRAGQVQSVDISNAPWSRPEIGALLRGLTHMQEVDYPIRGTVY